MIKDLKKERNYPSGDVEGKHSRRRGNSKDPKARAQPGGQCDWSREREGKQEKPGWGRKGERSQTDLQPLQGSQLFL